MYFKGHTPSSSQSRVYRIARLRTDGIHCHRESVGKMKIFTCPHSRLRSWSRETGSAVPSRTSLLILHPQAETGAYSQGFLPISAAASIYVSEPQYAIGSVPSLLGYAIAHRWRPLTPRVHRHRASSSQGSSSDGCCLSITVDELISASLFPHPP